MWKKILFVALTWFVVAVAVLVLYLLREVSPVKDFIAWALSIWPILALLVMAAAAASGWVIKHDFGLGNKKYIRSLRDIPEIIYKMHKRLTVLVACMPLLTKTEVDSFRDDYLELWGLDESRYPELKQITPTSDVKADREVLRAVLDKLLQTFTEVDDVKLLLIRTGGLMNVRGTGISQMRDKDRQYAGLERRLAKVRPEIPTELNTAIDNYLQFSFGSNSLYRLISSIPYEEITNVLPSKWSGEMGIGKERMDTAMNELLAEVNSVIQKLTHERASSPSTSHKEGSQP
jgi:hypothetical protein